MKVNWRAYFTEFTKLHGGDPVSYRNNPEVPQSGHLLFPDGWMYSARNVEGPETKPPADEQQHLTLIRQYWIIRKDILSRQFVTMRDGIEGLVRAQQTRSALLQIPQTSIVETEGGGYRRAKVVAPVDFKELLFDLRALREEIITCQRKLNKIEIPESAFAVQINPAEMAEALSLIDQGAKLCQSEQSNKRQRVS